MTKFHVLRFASIGMATLGLGLGVAAADSVTVGGTANNSNITVRSHSGQRLTVRDNSTTSVGNTNSQGASSGGVSVYDAASVGGVSSGMASAANMTGTSISGSAFGGLGSMPSFSSSPSNVTINGTYNDSNVRVNLSNWQSMKFVDNSSTSVSNYSTQSVSSGSVNVNDVASSGNVTSGDASASNTTSTSITR